MVTERPLSPQCVGREFVRQYYTLLNEAPAHLHRFYNNNSSFIHGGRDSHNQEVAVVGQRQIHQRIQQLNFRDCHTKINQVDSQATLGDGVVVQVSGELSNAGQPMRRFNQTFVLAPQNPKKYYVHNDIFRYQDMLSDDEMEGEMGQSEVDEDQEQDQQLDMLQPDTNAGYYAMNPPINGTSETIHEEPAPVVISQVPTEPLPPMNINTMEMIPPQSNNVPEPQAYMNQDIIQNQMDQDDQYHNQLKQIALQQPPPSQQIDSVNEAKTYANLLKSSAQMGVGPPVYYNSPPQHVPQHTPQAPQIMNDKMDNRPNHVYKPPRTDQRSHNFNTSPRQQYSNGNENGNFGGSDGERKRNQFSESRSQGFIDGHQLFIGNLPYNFSDEQYRDFFGKFGTIIDIRILCKQNKKNYGFITFEEASAVTAVLSARPIKFPDDVGEEINVEEKRARSSGGGGGGGGGGPPGGRGGPRGMMRGGISGGPPRSGGPGRGSGPRPFGNNRR